MTHFLRMPRLWLAIVVTAMTTAAALAAPRQQAAWSGVVSHVVDGDTVRVRPPDGAKPVSLRVEGIDAPEICQAGGRQARDALKRQVLGLRVAVYGRARDDYGRLLARIELHGEDQGRWMVAHGQAWSYRYRNSAGPYAAEQRSAQLAGAGIFSVSSPSRRPVNPREFRKRHGPCRFEDYSRP